MDKDQYNERARKYYYEKKERDPNFLESKNFKARSDYAEKIKDKKFKEEKRKRDLEYYYKNKKTRIAKQTEKRRNLLNEAKEKLGGKCIWCDTTENLEFDHIDDSKKEHSVTNAVRCTREIFWSEVGKCQLLCVNCHNKRTIAQKRAKQKLWLSTSFQKREEMLKYEMGLFLNCPPPQSLD